MAKSRLYAESESVERPPAFQQYAAATLSAEAVQLMTLHERGLFFTMQCYCWVNDSIPLDPGLMARALGLHADEVREHLTERVLSFFLPSEDDPNRLICPALVRQMMRLIDRREKQAQAGRDSAKKRRQKGNPALADRDANRSASPHALEYSTAELSKAKTSLAGGANESTSVDDPFVRDIEAADAKERAANGR